MRTLNPRRIAGNVVIFVILFLVLGGIIGGVLSVGRTLFGVVDHAQKSNAVLNDDEPLGAIPGVSVTEKTEALDVDPLSSEGSASVQFIDIGQGDATLFTFPDGETLLIDTGTYDHFRTLKRTLNEAGVEKLSSFIITHAHDDHMGSAASVLDQFSPSAVYFSPPPETLEITVASYQAFLDRMAKYPTSYISPEEGDIIMAGDNYQVTVVSRSLDPALITDINDTSMVTRIEIYDTVFLVMGDAEAPLEEDLLERGAPVDCDVLLLPHHGSSSSFSYDFAAKTHATYAVLSCASDNEYGFPHAVTLEKIVLYGIDLFRTDEQGTITATVTASGIAFDAEREGKK